MYLFKQGCYPSFCTVLLIPTSIAQGVTILGHAILVGNLKIWNHLSLKFPLYDGSRLSQFQSIKGIGIGVSDLQNIYCHEREAFPTLQGGFEILKREREIHVYRNSPSFTAVMSGHVVYIELCGYENTIKLKKDKEGSSTIFSEATGGIFEQRVIFWEGLVVRPHGVHPSLFLRCSSAEWATW